MYIFVYLWKQKKFGQNEFKKFHPSCSLGSKLKSVEDLMLTGKKIPFINVLLTSYIITSYLC